MKNIRAAPAQLYNLAPKFPVVFITMRFYREPPFLLQNNYNIKQNEIMSTNKFVRNLFLRHCLYREKWILKSLIFTFKFRGRRHLKWLWRVTVALLFWHKELLSNNNRATVTRHSYSRWRRPPNLETKKVDSNTYFFRIQTLSFSFFLWFLPHQ